jgi:hypothetical protein
MKKHTITLRLGQIEEKSHHPFSKILIKSLKKSLKENKKGIFLKDMKKKIEYEKENSTSKDHIQIIKTLERLYKDIKKDYDNHQELINRVANL